MTPQYLEIYLFPNHNEIKREKNEIKNPEIILSGNPLLSKLQAAWLTRNPNNLFENSLSNQKRLIEVKKNAISVMAE